MREAFAAINPPAPRRITSSSGRCLGDREGIAAGINAARSA
jgi:hypothetical protein